MKKVVYSCITGGYDNVPEYKYLDKTWDYILFTDNAELIKLGKYYHWTIRKLEFSKLDNVRNARWHKVNPHILFPEYQYSLWIDANISVNNSNIFKKCQKYINENIDIAVPLHPNRKCIYDEADAVKSLCIDSPRIVDREMKFIQSQKYPRNNGLHETGILFRNHNKMSAMSDEWWNMISKYSKRDQLSFDFVAWKYGINITPMYTIPGMHRTCGDFTFVYIDSHNQDKIKKFKYPYYIGKIISWVIPNKRNRAHFMKKYVQMHETLKTNECTNDIPRLLVYTYANKKYYDFAILYPIWVMASNNDTIVEIALDNLHNFKLKYQHLIDFYQKNFGTRVKFTQINRKLLNIPAGTVRFISQPQNRAKYIYIGDIDILILHNIYETHIKNIDENKLDFSNIKRIGQYKLSGLHFIEYDKMYPQDMRHINIKSDNDEHILYMLMKNKGYKIPNEKTQQFRPLCGIHISYFSRPPLKTLTTHDSETNFPCWYDNCNNEKISDEINLYTKLRNTNIITDFCSAIKETDIDLRRIIQIIDMFIFYLQNNKYLLKTCPA